MPDVQDLLESIPDSPPEPSTHDLLANIPDQEQVTPLHAARFRARQEMPEETIPDFIGRNISFAAPVTQHLITAPAVERIKAGKATDQDYDTVARSERINQWKKEQGESYGKSVAGAVVGAPEMIAQSMLLPGAKEGSGFFKAAVVRGATTPLAPTFYLGQAAERAEEQGGSMFAPQNLLPALGQGALNNMILGSAAKQAQGFKNAGSRWLAGTAIGAGEMQAGKVAAGLVDKVLDRKSVV